jgi:hypothetical protein
VGQPVQLAQAAEGVDADRPPRAPCLHSLSGASTLERLTKDVKELAEFTSSSLRGLATPVAAGDNAPLLKVMGHLFAVKVSAATLPVETRVL